MLWDAKVSFASSKFKEWHPDSSLLEQDYGVIKAINDSLPEQRRINAFEWYMYQKWYMTCNLGFSHAPEAMRKQNAISAAMYRTKYQYTEDFRTGATEFYGKKTTLIAKGNASAAKKNAHKNPARHCTTSDKVLIDIIFFGAIAALIWWRIKAASKKEQKEEEYQKAQKSAGLNNRNNCGSRPV